MSLLPLNVFLFTRSVYCHVFKLGAYKQYSLVSLFFHTSVTLLNLVSPQCSACGAVSLLCDGYIRAVNA